MIPMNAYPASSVVPIFFTTYGKTNGESITLTGLAVTDIEIYKGTSMTQRSSDAGYTLLDTDGIDIDSVTGLHGFSIDLGDNTDAGFYAVGSFYTVVVSTVTVDSQTVTFIADRFRIAPAEGVTGHPKVDVGAWLGTAAATPTVAGVPEVDVTHLLGTAWLTPGTAGTPDVNAKLLGAAPVTATTSVTIPAASTLATTTGAVGSVTGAVGSVTGLTAATVHSDLDDIQARLPAALTAGGMMKSSVNEWKEVTAAVVDSAGYPKVTIKTGTGTGEISMASGVVQSNAVAISGDTVAADNAEAFFDGTGYAGTNNVIPTVTTTATATNVTTVNGLAANVITAASIATGAIDADALAADAGIEIGTAVWATAARTLTANTNFNDPTAAAVASAVVGETITELAAIPAASPTLKQALALLYMALRNKVTVTSSAKTVYNDAGTSLGAKALSDDGTTYTEAEIA